MELRLPNSPSSTVRVSPFFSFLLFYLEHDGQPDVGTVIRGLTIQAERRPVAYLGIRSRPLASGHSSRGGPLILRNVAGSVLRQLVRGQNVPQATDVRIGGRSVSGAILGGLKVSWQARTTFPIFLAKRGRPVQ